MNKVTISWDDEGVVTIKVRPNAIRMPKLDWGNSGNRKPLFGLDRDAPYAREHHEEAGPAPVAGARTAPASKEELEAILVAAADKGFEASGEEWQCSRCRRSVFSQGPGTPKGWHQPNESCGKAATCNECKLVADRMARAGDLVVCSSCEAWEWERPGEWRKNEDELLGEVDVCPICNGEEE